ncbi:MAG: hypothetical protein IJO73_02520 [Clostridia bacterium]|nr:hypothetical protein [Clostridia bacterium]
MKKYKLTDSYDREVQLQRRLNGTAEKTKPNKKHSNFLVIAAIVLILLSVFSLSVNLYQQIVIRKLNLDYTVLNKQSEELKTKYNKKSLDFENLQAEHGEIIHEYNYYKKYVVFINSNDKHYHSYLCFKNDRNSSEIYDVKSAKAKGYIPCTICYKEK